MIDVLIQTHNEELNLPHTLASLSGGWINRVFVVDSGSTDDTRAIAEQWGATFVEHAWEGYARQKNWALDHLPFEADWVLIVDADEAVSPSLRERLEELSDAEAGERGEMGFYLNRVFIFSGEKIWHCGYYPSWNLRFFRRGRCRYEERRVHEYMVCDGPTGRLRPMQLLLHEDRRGLEHFYAKHNRYSTLEAREMFENPEPWPGWRSLASNTVRRRRFIKSRVLPRTPAPWLGRFFFMYVLRLGFLDGRAGWQLANFISAYELSIQLKYRELDRGQRYDGAAALAVPEGALAGGMTRASDASSLIAMPRRRAADPEAPAQASVEALVLAGEASEDEVASAVEDARRLGGSVVVVGRSGDGGEGVRHAAAIDDAIKSSSADWLFVLRGDERLTPRLIREVRAMLRRDAAHPGTSDVSPGYGARCSLVFRGKVIRFGGCGSGSSIRLVRRVNASVWAGEADGPTRVAVACEGPPGNFSGRVVRVWQTSLNELVRRHIRAADVASDYQIAAGGRPSRSAVVRPLARLLNCYVLRLGILDGRAGWTLASLSASEALMTSLMTSEKLRRSGPATGKTAARPRPAVAESR